MKADQQQDLPWGKTPDERGFLAWRAEREAAQAELAREMGLPIGRSVEVWLKDGIRLRGKLELKDHELWVEQKRNPKLRLSVEGVVFTADEIESCIRTEGDEGKRLC